MTQRDGTGMEVGREVQNWEHVYTHGRFMLMYAKPIQYCNLKKKKVKKKNNK